MSWEPDDVTPEMVAEYYGVKKTRHPELPDEEQFEPNYHSSQPDGFPDGEGEYMGEIAVDSTGEEVCTLCWQHFCRCQEVFDSKEDPYSCESTVDPRLDQNQRYEAIQEAARWIYEVIDTHPVGDGPVGTAIKEIKYKLWWVSTTGQGMEDIT
jgi:hypothetical protein